MIHSKTDSLLPTEAHILEQGQARIDRPIIPQLPRLPGWLSLLADADLLFVLREPGVLRLPLDPQETQIYMNISEHVYAVICADDRLSSSSTGRDYFEPMLRHHSFWDLLRFWLLEQQVIRQPALKQPIEDFLDEIARSLESGLCATAFLNAVFHEASVLASKLPSIAATTGSDVLATTGSTIAESVAAEFSRFGRYCRGRMRAKNGKDRTSPPTRLRTH